MPQFKKTMYSYLLCFGKKENNGTINREMETHRCVGCICGVCVHIYLRA